MQEVKNQLYSLTKANELGLVGGKAFALGKMVRAGFTVPNGFVVPANAFMAMTPPLQKLILEQFDALNADFVAVRSSAINEDGTDAAWAGQLDTFLNCSRANVLQRIEQCWQSANSARAKSYAEQKALASTKVAVIVQQMVPSDVSGVAFSVHPVTHDNTQVVIEAGFGLGEAIVSGQITPDTYIVTKKNGQCTESHISHQTKKLVRNAAGETVWQGIGAEGSNQKLSETQIAELCQVTTKLEHFFGFPVDVEWAINNGALYVLQARPITTLEPK